MENFGKFCLTTILIITSTIAGGFVFQQLYEWFILTTFNAPAINIPQSIGICIIGAFFKPKQPKDGEEFSIERYSKKFFETMFTLLLMLGLGWIITLFL